MAWTVRASWQGMRGSHVGDNGNYESMQYNFLSW